MPLVVLTMYSRSKQSFDFFCQLRHLLFFNLRKLKKKELKVTRPPRQHTHRSRFTLHRHLSAGRPFVAAAASAPTKMRRRARHSKPRNMEPPPLGAQPDSQENHKKVESYVSGRARLILFDVGWGRSKIFRKYIPW